MNHFILQERAFQSTCPRQHLMDIQELYGHATGLLVSQPFTNEWDMRDILGVFVDLNPFQNLNKRRRITAASDVVPSDDAELYLHLLPICLCFTCENAMERIEGCSKCNSDMFNKTVTHYSTSSYFFDKFSLEKTIIKVAEARIVARTTLKSVSDTLLPFLRRTKLQPYFDYLPETSTRSGQIQFDEWVADVLFMDLIVPHTSSSGGEGDALINALTAFDTPESLSIAALIKTIGSSVIVAA
jgi:hypothetical protein